MSSRRISSFIDDMLANRRPLSLQGQCGRRRDPANRHHHAGG